MLRRPFTTRDGRILRVAAFEIDTGGHHAAQVFSFCRRRGGRVFPCKGIAGNKPLWPTTAVRSKSNDKLWILGVDAGKDAISTIRQRPTIAFGAFVTRAPRP